MTDEKLFQYLVSRVQVRETSTLTVAAIASSASIILLGLYFSPSLLDEEMTQERNIIFWVGILSPIIGFSYFEIIFATQQSWDYNTINKMIREETKLSKYELHKIIFGNKRSLVIFKPSLWRVLLSIPIISWLSLDINLGWFILLIIMNGLAISLLIYRIELNKDKLIKEAYS